MAWGGESVRIASSRVSLVAAIVVWEGKRRKKSRSKKKKSRTLEKSPSKKTWTFLLNKKSRSFKSQANDDFFAPLVLLHGSNL